MTKRILDFYASVETITTQLVRMIVSIASFSIGELAPLAAPLAPSFSIYLAMSQRLNMPLFVALIAAGTIEIVGMYSAKISVRCYRWNVSRNKSEAVVPQGLSIAMTAIFYVVVLALALTIELIPSLTALIFPAFTLISVSVYVNMAIDQNLRKLETDKANDLTLRQEKNGLAADIRQAKTDLELLRTEAQNLASDVAKLAQERDTLAADIKRLATKKSKVEARQTSGQANGNTATFGPHNLDKARDISTTSARAKREIRRARILELKGQDLTNVQIAAELDCSLTTVKNDLKALNGKVAVPNA